MNVNRKTLILAIAAGMGMIPIAGVFAAPPAGPLGKIPGTTTVSGPVYSPAENKENSVAYYTVYDNAPNATNQVATAVILAGSHISAGGDLNTYIYTIPGYRVRAAETKSLTVKVALTGGAKFVKAPALICVHSGAANGADSRDGIMSAGATWASVGAPPNPLDTLTKLYALPTTNTTPGLASYTFAFPEEFAVSEGGSGACLLSFSAGAITMANNDMAMNSALTLPANASDVSLNVDVTYDDFFAKVTKSTAISMISFMTAYTTEFTQAVDVATIDVSTLSKKFTGGKTTVYIGKVIVTPTKEANGVAAKKFRNASGFSLSATDVLTAASVTISGPTIATLSKVSLHTAAAGVGCGQMVVEGAPTVAAAAGGAAGTGGAAGGTSDSVTIAIPAGSQSYGALVSALGAVAPGNNHVGLNVCLVAEGNTVMSDGSVTLAVNGINGISGKVFELGSRTDFHKVKRNGTVVRVLNVPGDAADPYRVNIRMYNTSNQPVSNILGTLYGVDGKIIADNITLAASLAPNNLKLLTSDNMVTLVGKPWTGRAWLLIQAPVDAAGFKVQVLIKQPSGVLANISTDATD